MVHFANAMREARASIVRELLKAARPDLISLAGGLPAAELFPKAELAAAAARVFADDGGSALQYSATEGHLPLRRWFAAQFAARGAAARPEEVLVTAGSQQAIDLASRVFLEPGATAAVEQPGYLAAIQAFRLTGADLVGVPVDEAGIDPDALDRICRQRKVRLVYTVSEFQNPTGVTLSAERRSRLVELADRHGFVLIDDNPYGSLRYEGDAPRAVAAGREAGGTALEGPGRVVSLGSLSKMLAPGLRLGYVMAAAPIMARLVHVKQAADLHTSSLGQQLAAHFLERVDLPAHLETLRAEYRRRRDALLAALPDALPVGSCWTRPEGGMFVWATLAPGWDAMALFRAALEAGAAFVPGEPFFVDPTVPEAARTLRLNFSSQPAPRIAEAARRLGAAARQLALR